MSLVISSSFNQDMDLLAAATIDNSEVGTFEHSQFSGNNINDTFTTPRRDLNSSAGNTVSPLTLNTMTTVIDTPISVISTGTNDVDISPNGIFNVLMSPSLLGIGSPNTVIAIQTPLLDAQIAAANFMGSPDIMGNQITTPPIMGNQITPPPIMGNQITPPPIMGNQVTSPPPIMGNQVILIMEDPVILIMEGPPSILQDIMDEPIEPIEPIEQIRKKPRF